jgi:hypothetical protein
VHAGRFLRFKDDDAGMGRKRCSGRQTRDAAADDQNVGAAAQASRS